MLTKGALPLVLLLALAGGLPLLSAAAGPDQGISQDEYLSFSPPAPQAVVARRDGEGVHISWLPPELPPTVRDPAYDTRVRVYLVYRREPGGQPERIGKTRKTIFTDRTAKPGKTLFYSVKAKQCSGHESDFSAEFRLDSGVYG